MCNSSSESHSPGFSGRSNSVGGISESLIATVRESNSENGGLGKRVGCDLRHNFTRKHGCQGPVRREHVQDLDESDDDEKPLVSLISSNQKVKSSVKVTKGDTLLRQKRLQKPTLRYIEEFSRNSSTEKNKSHKIQPQEEFPQVPSESRPRRGRPKKIVLKSVGDVPLPHWLQV